MEGGKDREKVEVRGGCMHRKLPNIPGSFESCWETNLRFSWDEVACLIRFRNLLNEGLSEVVPLSLSVPIISTS